MIIAIIGGSVYFWFSYFLSQKVDDPVDASAVHGACGMWGALAVGLFAAQDRVLLTYGGSGVHYGLLMGGGGMQLLCQLIGVCNRSLVCRRLLRLLLLHELVWVVEDL